MAMKPNSKKVTGNKAATAASKTLRKPSSPAAAKTAAGSALAQKPKNTRKQRQRFLRGGES